MKKSEKLILLSLATQLNNSTQTTWSKGDLDDFSEWGKKMRATILTAIATIKAMTDDTLPEEKEEKEITLSEILDAIERLTRANENKNQDIDSGIKFLVDKLKKQK